MRKFLSVLLAVLTVLSIAPVAASADYSLGFKVEDDTAYIYTADELMALAEYFNSEYRKYLDSWDTGSGEYKYDLTYFNVEIMDAIDLTDKAWVPIEYYGIKERLTFDGNGHTISNMSIVVEDGDDTAHEDLGFFSDIENADIMNLSVEGKIYVYCDYIEENIGGFGGDVDSGTVISNCHANVDIEINAIAYGEFEIGGFIGDLDDAYIFNSTSVSDILVRLDIYYEDYKYDIGGFIGDLDDSVIAGCHAKNGEIDIHYYSYDEHWNYTKAGGFAGESDDSAIYSSSASVDIEIHDDDDGPCDSTNALGGLVGESENLEIYNSFAAGELKSDCLKNDVGGLVGENEDGYLIIENCYSLSETKIIDKEGSSNNIGGIIGDHESDATYSLKNVWSGANNEYPDSDNINGDDIPLDESGDFDMAKLTGLLNTGVKQLNEEGIPYITVWSYDDEKDSYPGAASPLLMLSVPSAETPMFNVEDAAEAEINPEFRWQYGILTEVYSVEPTEIDTDVTNNELVPEWKKENETGHTYRSMNSDADNEVPKYDETECEMIVEYKVEDGGAIGFKWGVSSESNFDYLWYAIYDKETDGDNFYDSSIISGDVEMTEVLLDNLSAGEYIVAFEYCKNESKSEGLDCGMVDLTPIISGEDIEWTDIEGEEDHILVNANYTGKYVRCVVKYTQTGQVLYSEPFIYNYEAIDFDSLEKYTDTTDSNDTTTMVPLFFGTTVRVYDAANGTITPNGIPMIIGGMEMTFKFIPDDGYAVADVLLNGESVGAVEALTIDGWQGYVKLTAVFEPVETEVVEP